MVQLGEQDSKSKPFARMHFTTVVEWHSLTCCISASLDAWIISWEFFNPARSFRE